MKIKFKQQDNRIVIRVKTPRKSKIDEGGIRYFSDTQVRGLFSPDQESLKSNSVEYVGPISIPLSEWLSAPHRNDEYYKMIMQAIDLAQRVEGQGMPLGFVNFDLDNTFINVATGELYFLFIPILEEPPMVDIRAFLEAASLAFIPDSEMTARAKDEFLYFMSSLPGPDLNRMESLIAQRNPDIVKRVKRLGVSRTSPSAFINNGMQHAHQQGMPAGGANMPGAMPPNGMNAGMPMNPGMQPGGMPPMNGGMNQGMNPGMNIGMNPGFGMNPGGMNSGMPMNPGMQPGGMAPMNGMNPGMNPGGMNPGLSSMSTQPDGYPANEFDETAIISENFSTGGDYTEPAGMVMSAQRIQPYCQLFRVKTKERIPIDQLVFRLGREKSSDYQIRGNSAVGRSHCDLVLRDNGCYVVDRNSMNKTYINGSVLVPQRETPISDGDCLRLADEEFIFSRI